MARNEVFDQGQLVEWFGVDGTDWVHCIDGEEVERRPATDEELAAAQPPEAMDLAALADEVVATRERLAAAEDALFFLLTNSLEV